MYDVWNNDKPQNSSYHLLQADTLKYFEDSGEITTASKVSACISRLYYD